MIFRRAALVVGTLWMAASLTVRVAVAQTESATVSGLVVDESGAVVPNADVELISVAQGSTVSALTSSSGIYVFPNVHPGQYQITVRKQNFKQVDLLGLTVNVQDHIQQNFRLQIGSTSESVTVEGGNSLVDTESSTVGTVITRQFVENLPLNGRSFHSLLELTPGVVLTPTSEQGEQGQFAINGNRADGNYFSIDGVSANFDVTPVSEPGADAGGALPALSALGGTNNLVSVDALQEFRLDTSDFAPEFGRGGAQVLLVTRSGTNQFHGAAFDYLRNDIFDANDWFANSLGLPKPPIRQNDFGGVFGGPIVQNKTFFFFSYEGLRLRQPKVGITDVPSLYARANAAPVMQPYFAAYPLPNGPPTLTDSNGNVLANQFAASYSDPASLNAYSLRIDQILGTKWTLFGRFDYAPSYSSVRNAGGYAPLSDKTIESKTTETTTIGLTGVLTPHVTNDFRFNYSTDTGSLAFAGDNLGGAVPLPDSVAFPPGYGSSLNSGGGIWVEGLRGTEYQVGVNSRNNRQHQLQFIDSVTLLRGNHQWKFGADFRRLRPYFNPRQFDDFPIFFDMQDALTGVVDFLIIQNNTNTPQLLYHEYAAYIQDTWKVSPRLSMTYGLRWERNPPPSELTGHPLLAVNEISDLATMQLEPIGTRAWSVGVGNFAPRIGANYLLRQSAGFETVVRGGFGIFYALGTETTGNVANDFENPWNTTLYEFGVPLPLTQPAPAASTTLAPPYGDSVVFDPHLKVPYTAQWNVAIEQALGSKQRFSATYIGSIGRRLLRQNAVNSTYLPVNPDFTNVFVNNNTDYSNYNALQIQYQRRLSHGLQVLTSYTWSHSLDNGSGDSIFGPGPYGDNSQDLPSNFYNVKQDYASSNFDIRNAFSFATTYSLPGHGLSNAFARNVLEGWSVDGVVRARSAPPFTVIYLPNLSPYYDDQAGESVYFRADTVPGQPSFIPDSSAPGGRVINPAAFTTPTFATIQDARQGTEGRNALRAFGATQADISLRREFAVHENLTLTLRLDAFNITNHPNFGYPQGNLSLPGFGEPSLTLAQTLGSGNGFGGGFNPLYAVGGPRSMQASLKLQF